MKIKSNLHAVSVTQKEYMKKRKRQKTVIYIWRFLLLFLFILLWEAATQLGWLNAFIFSSPSRMANSFSVLMSDGTLLRHIGVTLAETCFSFVIVMAASILISLALWALPTVSAVLEPYLVVLNSLPKSALAPVLIVWLGNNIKTVIVCGISVAVFGSIMTLYTGFKEVDEEKIKLIYTLKGSKKDVVAKVLLPYSIPAIMSSMKVNIGLCLVGVIIGEFLSANAGLGYLIIYSSQVFKMDYVILSIFILCIVAIGLYAIINLLERLWKSKNK